MIQIGIRSALFLALVLSVSDVAFGTQTHLDVLPDCATMTVDEPAPGLRPRCNGCAGAPKCRARFDLLPADVANHFLAKEEPGPAAAPSQLEAELLTEIIESHELMEPSESRRSGVLGFLETFIKKFNFYEMTLNIERAVWLERHRAFRANVLDIAFLTSLSHPMEMLSGPLFNITSNLMHWPTWVTSVGTTAGLILGIPGLDLVCIALYAIYWRSPKFRDWTRTNRLRVMESAVRFGTRFPQVVSELKAWREPSVPLEVIAQKEAQLLSRWKKADGGEYRLERGEKSLTVFKNDKSLLTIYFSEIQGDKSIKEVSWDRAEDRIAKRVASDLASFFLRNPRDAIRLAFRSQEDLQHHKFVAGIVHSKARRSVVFPTGAMAIHNWKCRSLLQAIESRVNFKSTFALNF